MKDFRAWRVKPVEGEVAVDKEADEQKPVWWKRKSVVSSAIAGCVGSALFFTGWGVHLGDATYLTRTYGAVGSAADGMYSGLDDFFGIKAQIKGDDGHGGVVTYAGADSMGVTDGGLLYAPKPSAEFKNESCPLYPAGVNGSSADAPKSVGNRAAGWWAPSLRTRTQVVQGAQVTPSGFSNNNVTLPAAPNGIWYASGSPLSSNSGASILAGHINLNDGSLSPWGYLHRLDKCAHIYMNDEHGDRHEFVVTGMYLVKQEDLASHSELWRKDGDKKAYFITCSGSSVGTDGTQEASSTFLFNYEFNLVVEGTPVDGSYPKPTPSSSEGLRKPVVTEIPATVTETATPTPQPTVSTAPEPAPSTEAVTPPEAVSAPAPAVTTNPAVAPPVEATPAVAANNNSEKSVSSNNSAVAPISRATAAPAPAATRSTSTATPNNKPSASATATAKPTSSKGSGR